MNAGIMNPVQWNPLQSFPEEIWRMIIARVEDNETKWTLYNTDPLFATILAKWKLEYVMSVALPVIYRRLEGQELLLYREVCQSWNRAVLKFLENHSSLRPHGENSSLAQDSTSFSHVCPLKEKLLSWRNKVTISCDGTDPMDGYLANAPAGLPFIGRYVILELLSPSVRSETDDERLMRTQRLWERVYRFMRAFGRHILHLSVIRHQYLCQFGRESMIRFILSDVFHFAPFLRMLTVNRISMNLVEPIVCTIPYVPAPHLETFQSDTASADVVHLDLLGRYANQLGKVVLGSALWTRTAHLRWPRLTELRLNKLNHTGQDLLAHRLLNLIPFPQLGKIALDLEVLCGNRTRNILQNLMRQLVAVCNHCPVDTVRLVGFRDMTAEDRRSDPRCMLPQTVKTLELEHSSGTWTRSFDFLLVFAPHIKSLRIFMTKAVGQEMLVGGMAPALGPNVAANLRSIEYPFLTDLMKMTETEMCIDTFRYNYNGETLGFGDMITSMDREIRRCRIWVLMTRLESITFQWEEYLRHDFERFVNSV